MHSQSVPVGRHALADLCDFVQQYPRLLVLTGAGISTDSGLPGYRDADGRWRRTPPVLVQDFLRSESVRQRYWARSMVGWRAVANARPNIAHDALARLEAAGRLQQLVTQNVDGLHQRAGSSHVIELHGNLDRVVCLDCGALHSRASIQRILESLNPESQAAITPAAADGDADVERRDLDLFRVPQCSRCAGVLKPNVVFFGEGVPKGRVDSALRSLEQADAMLVVGSSLMVYSGFRFCEWADTMGKPIAAINLGRTRADHLLALKIERPCAEALASLVERLGID
ncbi:MAG TPA: NAD-dependent protein deacetylase [Casimicrobiaceae bacterium]|nr:NAD-dependent protein deacetylase [Casimicrobiaceae bacterium]